MERCIIYVVTVLITRHMGMERGDVVVRFIVCPCCMNRNNGLVSPADRIRRMKLEREYILARYNNVRVKLRAWALGKRLTVYIHVGTFH